MRAAILKIGGVAVMVGAAVATSLTAGAEGTITATSEQGTLRVAVEMNFNTGSTTSYAVVDTGDDVVPVAMDIDHAEDLAGSTVKMTGRMQGDYLQPSAEPQVLAAAVPAPTQKKIAVILFNFSDNRATPWTQATVEGVFFNNTDSVKAYYEDASDGAWSVTGQVFGFYEIAASSANCNSNFNVWASQAYSAASADLAAAGGGFTNYVYAFPATSCGWSGLAYMPGTGSWLNGAMSLRVAAHELGHNFGVDHASTVTCTESGQPVALPSTGTGGCAWGEYGDPFTVMGAATRRLHHGWHQAQIGYAMPVQTVTTSGQYTIQPLESSSTNAHLLRIQRPDGKFLWLEFRNTQPTFDDFASGDVAVNGVTIRLAPSTSTIIQSQLLDTTPGDGTFTNAPLAVGRTFTDSATNVSITTVSTSPSGAVVDIAFGGGGGGGGGGGTTDTQAPSAPTNLAGTPASTTVALTWSASTDNVGVTSYEVRRNGTVVANPTTTSWTDTGRASNTTYTYEVRAKDAANNTSPAASVSVTTTSAGDTTPPSVPSRFTARKAGADVNLSWRRSTDNVGVVGYRVLRNSAVIAEVTTLSYKDLALPVGTHVYQVQAVDAAGNVSGLSPAKSITFAPDTSAPSRPSSLRARLANGDLVLTWRGSRDNVGVAGYRVLRDGVEIAVVTTPGHLDVAPPTGQHGYSVVAFDAAGNQSLASATVSATV